MEVIYPCCCGLDVQKKSITACVLWAEAKGKSRKQKKRFGTFTHDLLQLAEWLGQCGVRAHALLVIAFHMLKRKENYHELGADHFDRIDIGRKVTLELLAQTA
jgi:hypothetical protein